jgi:acyl carrier protein
MVNEELEREIKELIIEAAMLEDVTPDEIEPTGPLFVEGLGLDSIDALEIAMALEKRFGIAMDDDADANQKRFASLRSLAAFVAENLAASKG